MRKAGAAEHEAIRRASQSQFVKNIIRLTTQGVLGFYNYCEVTEIFAVQPDSKIVNIFSIFVLEERALIPEQTTPVFLTEKLITLKGSGFNGFGVSRYFITIERLYQIINDFIDHDSWQPNGKELLISNLAFTRSYFVPPNATDEVSINSMLKNNFWNGSHILEFFAQNKTPFNVFLEKPSLLQELSEKLQTIIPIRLASLSDRLGNIIFQFPINVLRTKFGFRGDIAISLEIAWDRRVLERSLMAVSLNKFDNTYPGFAIQTIGFSEKCITINTGDSTQITNTFIWDSEHQILLAASGGIAAVRQIYLHSHPIGPEPRQIVMPASDQTPTLRQRIKISGGDFGGGSLIGDQEDEFSYRDQVNARKYSQEQKELLAKKDFVQYGKHTGRGYDEAIADLRSLIGQYGGYGVWLWDPYLSAIDVMQTLFFCSHGGVALRALGSSDQKTRKQLGYSYDQLECWKSEQQAIFNTEGNNYDGLQLEFRVRHGDVGWSFHDRFLIFPIKDQEPRAYSLGTSVNSLGKDHHILQRVSNGRLVADAFQELWELLDADNFLVWKYPQ